MEGEADTPTLQRANPRGSKTSTAIMLVFTCCGKAFECKRTSNQAAMPACATRTSSLQENEAPTDILHILSFPDHIYTHKDNTYMGAIGPRTPLWLFLQPTWQMVQTRTHEQGTRCMRPSWPKAPGTLRGTSALSVAEQHDRPYPTPQGFSAHLHRDLLHHRYASFTASNIQHTVHFIPSSFQHHPRNSSHPFLTTRRPHNTYFCHLLPTTKEG